MGKDIHPCTDYIADGYRTGGTPIISSLTAEDSFLHPEKEREPKREHGDRALLCPCSPKLEKNGAHSHYWVNAHLPKTPGTHLELNRLTTHCNRGEHTAREGWGLSAGGG